MNRTQRLAETRREASGLVRKLGYNPGPNEVYRCCHTHDSGKRQHTLRGSPERAFSTLGPKTKELVNSVVATIPASRWRAGKGLPSGD